MNVNSFIEDKFTKASGFSSLNRKQRDKLIRQADILRAAEHVFALKGFHEATMQDIAKEAQYATGTVYLYFKDKDALYLSLVEEKYRGLLTILNEETSKVKTAREKIEVFIYEKLSFFERNQNFFRIFVSERNKTQGIRVGRLHSSPLILQHKDFVAGLVKSAQEEHLIRNDFTARQIADVLISVFMSVVFNWLKAQTKETKNLSRMSDFIIDIFLNGVGRKK